MSACFSSFLSIEPVFKSCLEDVLPPAIDKKSMQEILSLAAIAWETEAPRQYCKDLFRAALNPSLTNGQIDIISGLADLFFPEQSANTTAINDLVEPPQKKRADISFVTPSLSFLTQESFTPERLQEIWTEVTKKTIPQEKIDMLKPEEAVQKYRDVGCPRKTAVRIGGQYLNANIVSDPLTGNSLVAAQYPTDHNTLWKFVATQGYSIIDLSGVACLYAPDLGETKSYSSVEVRCVSKISEELFETYSYEILIDGKTVPIKRFVVSFWPDRGVISVEKLRSLVDLVEKVSPKAFIHCMGGIGRTGVVVTSSFLRDEIKKRVFSREGLPQRYVELLVDLRSQRHPMFVQNKPQSDLVLNTALEELRAVSYPSSGAH